MGLQLPEVELIWLRKKPVMTSTRRDQSKGIIKFNTAMQHMGIIWDYAVQFNSLQVVQTINITTYHYELSAESRTFDECVRLKRTSDHRNHWKRTSQLGSAGIRFTSSNHFNTPWILGVGSNLFNNHGSFSTTKDGNIYIYIFKVYIWDYYGI